MAHAGCVREDVPNMLETLDDRQKLLGGITLLLILVHMIFPKAGIDATSVGMMGVLMTVLYGREAAQGLRLGFRMALDAPERRAEAAAAALAAQPGPPVSAPAKAPSLAQAELSERIRSASYQTEHARVAGATEGIGSDAPISESLEVILDRAGGQPRPALLLIWGALEDRLRAAQEAPDGLTGARKLAEQGHIPRQFVDAYAAFRSLRNDVARSGDDGVTDEVLWSLVDIGGALLALIPQPRGEKRSN